MEEENIPQTKPVTIILLGKSGHGKSASGNSIMSNDVFVSGFSKNPITLSVQQEETVINKRCVTVIDTPDPRLLTRKDIHFLNKLNAVLLLVLRCGTRMTKNERTSIDKLRTIFGSQAFTNRGIILLTHCDLFPLVRVQKDTSFLDSALMEEFENRIVFLSNREENHLTQITQIDDVMILVDDILRRELNNVKRSMSLKQLLCCLKKNNSYTLSD